MSELYIEEIDQEFSRENCSIFTFIGETALGANSDYDHVFVHEEDESGEVTVMGYLFRVIRPDLFKQVFDHAKRHNFQQHLNLPEVSKVDRQAFDYMVYDGFSEHLIPENFQEAEDGAAE